MALDAFQAATLAVYAVALAPLTAFGLHRGLLLAERASNRPPPVPPAPDLLPTVLVQLPLFNERDVAERVIRAAAALDWPRDRLVVQVLDDSTDDTTERVRAVAAACVAAGVDVRVRHRVDRRGFKAGALADGLDDAPGELVAVFDADFVPAPDFLRRMVPSFAADVGMVQARWGHLNAEDGALTAVQAILLDGHFAVEHAARAWTGRWFNFNGTAGIWRRQAIRDGGGWRADTLTEDLDLSYRAQLAGWRFVYRDDVEAPAELPATLLAFQAQQRRWATGGVQCARRLLGPLWRARVPVRTKVEGTFHLTANLAHPLVLLLSALLPLVAMVRPERAPPWLLAFDVVILGASLASVGAFYGGAVAFTRGGWRRARWLPAVLALGVGMSASQAAAAWRGLWLDGGVFVRTPKQGAGAGSYRAAGTATWGVEAALAAWLFGGVLVAASRGQWASVPFLTLFLAGHGWVALGRARERRAARSTPPPRARTTPAPS